MSKRVYDFDAVYAAMCIWEEMCTPTLSDAGIPWHDMANNHGSDQMRHWIVEELAEACDAAWRRASDLHDTVCLAWNHARRQHEVEGKPFEEPPPPGPGSFDWEFVAVWMHTTVDWSGEQPRVMGTTKP